MALDFPAPSADGIYSLRVYETGTATTDYADNQFSFSLPTDATKQAWSKGIRIQASGGNISFSFDGTNDHGYVADGDVATYSDRYEGGIAIKGTGTFTLEAW